MDTSLSSYPGPAWSQSVLDRVSQLEAGSHSVDGVTIKLDENKVASVPLVQGASVDANGVAGLVPVVGPSSTLEAMRQLLTADGFCSVALSVLHSTAATAGNSPSNVLDMGGVAEGLNIDTLLTAGIFSANQFMGTLPPMCNGGVLAHISGFAASSGYYHQQFLYDYAYLNLWLRKATGFTAAGEVPSYEAWSVVGASKPTSSTI